MIGAEQKGRASPWVACEGLSAVRPEKEIGALTATEPGSPSVVDVASATQPRRQVSKIAEFLGNLRSSPLPKCQEMPSFSAAHIVPWTRLMIFWKAIWRA